MLQDVTLWTALIAGIISFISPCVLPLVPPYLAFMGGVSVQELSNEKSNTETLGTMALRNPVKLRVGITTLCFVLGFTTVFVLLGATASVLGQTLAQYLSVLTTIAGVAVIIMGLHFLGAFRLSLLFKQVRFNASQVRAGPAGAYVMGLAFGFGWTPCIGPVLGAILFMAGAEETIMQGTTLLFVYSLGIGVPFVLAGFFAAPFMRWLQKFRVHMGKVEKVMGALLVLTGIMFLTGTMQAFSFWLLETFPVLATIG